jgi:4-hydroxy-L-threonine phosphate dehydrogenase PdxA
MKTQGMKKKRLAVTMGDPGGIGAEIIVRAVASPSVRKCCIPVIIGDAGVMQEAIALLRLPTAIKTVGSPEEIKSIQNTIHVIDMKSIPGIKKRMPTPEGGAACARYIRKAVELASEKKVDGVVTAPISKEAMKLAGLPWPGHTEMLVTIHTAISQVPALITKKRVLKTIRLAEKACRMLDIKKPRIAVAGLNPHAGEAGMFGDEEINAIIPAIRAAVKEGIPVSGPWPPDTVFHKAYRGEIDMVVCMYHDQGLIPLKMIAFDTGVNVTVGLPFVRTSPDHGTAYDIAWKGIANPSSMIEAIKVASTLKI